MLDLAFRGLILLVLEKIGKFYAGAGNPKGFDPHLALRRAPEIAGSGGDRIRHDLAWQAEADAGGRVIHELPADLILLRTHQGGERGPLGRIEDTGLLGLV